MATDGCGRVLYTRILSTGCTAHVYGIYSNCYMVSPPAKKREITLKNRCLRPPQSRSMLSVARTSALVYRSA